MGEQYEKTSETILEGLKKFQECYSDDYYLDFERKISDMKRKIQESMKEGRLLKIGIVGEVKAGKSSFLNALIFNGEDILPKASTPMTAALTKISYGEHPSAKIVFYSQKDWDNVEQLSRKYDEAFEKAYAEYLEKFNAPKKIVGEARQPKTREDMRRALNSNISLNYVSCKELTNMFEKSDVDLEGYLGQEIELPIDDVNGGLQEYIGANGKFTSIVKHVELQMNREVLQEIEIVDTPGLNDPIVSRGEATKKFLGECDVVFLLSYTGQFLTQEDISFMRYTLPNEGIRNVIIVGSKFDSGILDNNHAKDLRTACNVSRGVYDGQARENIQKCLNVDASNEVLKRIKESLPPSYISALLFSCAKKKELEIPYSKQEANIIEQLKRHFSDFTDDKKILLSLSGIPQIKKNKLQPVKEEKKKIIDEKNANILQDNKNQLLKLLGDIEIQVLQNRDELERGDKEQLEKKLRTLQTKLNAMRREIRNIFESASLDASKCLNDMKVSLDQEIDNYMDFNVKTRTTQEEKTHRKGWDLFGLFEEHYTVDHTTYLVSISDVISNIRGYINRCRQFANEEFETMVNLRKLENAVKDSVIGAFDMSSNDFNENDILIPLEIVIKKIQIPRIEIDASKYEDMIVEAFSGAFVEGDEIHQLRIVEGKVLSKVAKKMREELDNCEREMQTVMTEQATTFVDNIIKQLTDTVETLKRQVDDKENAMRKYDELSKLLLGYKRMIKEMEM